MKYSILLCVCVLALMLSGCTQTVYVTSANQFVRSLDEIDSTLAEKGFVKSGEDNSNKNNLHVAGISYDSHGGYNTVLGNDYVYSYTSRYKNEDGNTLSYTLDYRMDKVFNENEYLYVYSVSVNGCNVSEPEDFIPLCNQTIAPKIDTMPRDMPVDVYNSERTLGLVSILAIIAIVIVFAVI
ncbi:MAG: hypothetical protein IJR13_08280 [Bacteroidales bacterium]|nr:hypothetical protein [Bacteroidales bacterium]